MKRRQCLLFCLIGLIFVISCTPTNQLIPTHSITHPLYTLRNSTTDPTIHPQTTEQSYNTLSPTILTTETPALTPTIKPTHRPTPTPKPTPIPVPSPNYTPTPSPTIQPTPSVTPSPTPQITATPTCTPSPTPQITTTPTCTPSPTAEPTPTQSNEWMVNPQEKKPVRYVNVNLTNTEKDIANQIYNIVINNPNSEQMYVKAIIHDKTPAQLIEMTQRIFAYLHERYFASVCHTSITDNYEISFVYSLHDGPMYAACYGSVRIGLQAYQDGDAYFLFIPKQLSGYMNDYNYSLSRIDSLLNSVSVNTEKQVAKQIAHKLLDVASYSSHQIWLTKMFATGKANCCAWAKAFVIACRRVGINAIFVDGTWNGSGHAWAEVHFCDGSTLYYDLARAKKGGDRYLGMEHSQMTGYKAEASPWKRVLYWGYASSLF